MDDRNQARYFLIEVLEESAYKRESNAVSGLFRYCFTDICLVEKLAGLEPACWASILLSWLKWYAAAAPQETSSMI